MYLLDNLDSNCFLKSFEIKNGTVLAGVHVTLKITAAAIDCDFKGEIPLGQNIVEEMSRKTRNGCPLCPEAVPLWYTKYGTDGSTLGTLRVQVF